ncbi:hypothetical protein M8756_13130 [Lutimaribacter sp. EGI FJ00015]|uniref:Uncharacterized protein n=1 Tax=Lutimaribacter degradans TaxID=2945989 RepID=A0ACC5ZZA2_9RHOB|nr:hypothetical protein [Lutimaribacter sp. EGI FJ00013]MCM2563076.1 hypothetical protein [Lutimaribacter sp. EGI FJ00013]MCO0614255.1 hypothetical protein [Lutimaribacter sp. EGI FJ00015]MCO0637065.1 hypothetical protein [Lutimaribacter sp. EGI FJ00014]
MSTFLPKDVQAGLDAARRQAARKRNRLRVEVDGTRHPVLRTWDNGFSVDPEQVPLLRGLVDLYDGAVHLRRCLIVAAAEEDGETRYDYKRMTEISTEQPLDFARAENAPVALLAHDTPE